MPSVPRNKVHTFASAKSAAAACKLKLLAEANRQNAGSACRAFPRCISLAPLRSGPDGKIRAAKLLNLMKTILVAFKYAQVLHSGLIVRINDVWRAERQSESEPERKRTELEY